MSSANWSTLFVILSSKSLIYIKNNKGPNTDPWGTQLKTDFQFETYPSTFVSSANLSTLLVILSSKSLLYIKNNKSPNTDPCGTPFKTDFQFETYPSTTIRCLLSVIHCSIQSIMPSPIP